MINSEKKIIENNEINFIPIKLIENIRITDEVDVSQQVRIEDFSKIVKLHGSTIGVLYDKNNEDTKHFKFKNNIAITDENFFYYNKKFYQKGHLTIVTNGSQAVQYKFASGIKHLKADFNVSIASHLESENGFLNIYSLIKSLNNRINND